MSDRGEELMVHVWKAGRGEGALKRFLCNGDRGSIKTIFLGKMHPCDLRALSFCERGYK